MAEKLLRARDEETLEIISATPILQTEELGLRKSIHLLQVSYLDTDIVS